MKLYEILDAAKENAEHNELEVTQNYIKEYAMNAYEESFLLTKEQAELMLSCYLDFEKNGNGTNDKYYMIESKLDEEAKSYR